MTPSQLSCGTAGVACFSCQAFETCTGSSCQPSAAGGGTATGGGTGTGGGGVATGGVGGGGGTGGGSGTGVDDPVDHLRLLGTTLTFDAGTCVSFQLEGRDNKGNQVSHVGAGLSYALEPGSSEVSVFGNGTCTLAGATYVQGPAVQMGSLRAAKFGETWVYPTVINPPSGYSQGPAVQVRSLARLSGFPMSLVYNACTPITLVATAVALNDTDLSLQSSGYFEFSGSGCSGPTLPVALYAWNTAATGYVRTSTGGTVQIVASPDVLRSNPVNVTVTRPDGGTCFGDGVPCGSNGVCCSDSCSGTCAGTM